MDKVRTTFDEWAKIGRDELMEREHTKLFQNFLNLSHLKKTFNSLILAVVMVG